MKIKWYGHACFRVDGDGTSIVIDPYTPEVAGLEPVDAQRT
ncbi:MAG: MBL fold metallo-hydrolase [Actinomycetota bacterium]|jgi:L-ascorbate metabolism protein UlaG (beta-lactamase superfamily)|nr:MBL fold metallo-hydrolase [Actinomycetota bacterium]